jgi:tRNA U38,U39,U40 pseudouridine synthase TruA
MAALSALPFASKLLDLQLARTETRNVVNTVKGGIADAIQPVDVVSFSGSRTDRGVSMMQQALETASIKNEMTMTPTNPTNNIVSASTISTVSNNALIVQDSPTDAGFRASASTI